MYGIKQLRWTASNKKHHDFGGMKNCLPMAALKLHKKHWLESWWYEAWVAGLRKWFLFCSPEYDTDLNRPHLASIPGEVRAEGLRVI